MQEALIQHTLLVLLLVSRLLQTQRGILEFLLISTEMHQFTIVQGKSLLSDLLPRTPQLRLFKGNHSTIWSSRCTYSTVFRSLAPEINWRLLLISVLMCTVFTLLFIPSVVVNLLPNPHCLDPRIHMSCRQVQESQNRKLGGPLIPGSVQKTIRY